MTVLIILGVAAFIALIVVFALISMRNRIVRGKNRAERAWANVITYERKKIKLIPNLEEMVGEYKDFEQGVLKKITELRSALSDLSEKKIDPNGLQEVETLTRSLMSGLKVAVEAYPDLKASDLYKSLMRELSEAEENVAAAIKIFNSGVESFNNSLEEFPSSWVNDHYNKEKKIKTFTDSEAESGLEYSPNF